MSSGVNGIKTVPHVVYVVSAVCVVVVHHIAEETVEVVEPSFARVVLRFEAEVPFTDNCGPVIFLFQGCWECGCVLSKVTPVVFWVGPNHPWYADSVGVASGHQRCATWRTDGGVGVKSGEPRAVGRDSVDVWCLD